MGLMAFWAWMFNERDIVNMKIKNLRILQGKIPEIISNKYNKIFTFENGLQSLVEVSD